MNDGVALVEMWSVGNVGRIYSSRSIMIASLRLKIHDLVSILRTVSSDFGVYPFNSSLTVIYRMVDVSGLYRFMARQLHKQND